MAKGKGSKLPIIVAVLVVLAIIGALSGRGKSPKEDVGDPADAFVGYYWAVRANLNGTEYDEQTMELLRSKGHYVLLTLDEDGTLTILGPDVNRTDRWKATGEGVGEVGQNGTPIVLEGDRLTLDDGALVFERITEDEYNAALEELAAATAASEEAEAATTDDAAATDASADDSSAASDEPAYSDEVSPDFKEAMDAYEAFIDEYVEFMKTYSAADDPTVLLAEYSDIMTRYAEYMYWIDSIDESELSPADEAYYLEVTGRVTQKLAEVAYM